MSQVSESQQLDRIQSYQAIQQLTFRYAVALDSHDAATWASLYVPDVEVGAPIHGRGTADLERWFYAKCSYWYRSMHLVGAHVIAFDDDDHAHGQVQCQVQQEIGTAWYHTAVIYKDNYERRDGQWLFAHRRGQPLWCYEQGQDPIQTAFIRTPTGMPIRQPAENAAFVAFWDTFSDDQVAAVTQTPVRP